MIVIGLGANLPTDRYGPPQSGLETALKMLGAEGVAVVRRSRWYRSAPVPRSGDPWYVNGVAEVETSHEPETLLRLMIEIERRFGRQRRRRFEPRVLDLDLLDYRGRVTGRASARTSLVLPHPRMHERAFVLLPLAEIAPDWRHPASGKGLTQLIGALGEDQIARPLEGRNS